MALAATLVGFGLLVVALITGTLWLAVACIVVCVLGGLFLLADLLGIRRPRWTRAHRRAATPSSAADAPDSESGDVEDPDSDVSDSEVTTEFPRYSEAEPVVTLGDSEAAWRSDIADSHAAGRHESSDVAEPAHGRHESQSAPETEDAPARHVPRHGAAG